MKQIIMLAALFAIAMPAYAAPQKKQKSVEAPASAPAQEKAWSGPQKRYYRTTEPVATTGSHSGHLGVAGCGLGSQVVHDHGKWSQVGAAFLNGTGFQTFAISFGTSNCEEGGMVAKGKEQELFLEANRADVEKELAMGGGEYLSSLAQLYGCDAAASESFQAALVRERASISGLNAKMAADRIGSVVSSDASLANCKI